MKPVAVNNLLNHIRHLGAMAMAPAFRVEAIRRYVMARAVPLSIQTGEYPYLEAKHLDNPRLFANRRDLMSSMRSIKGGVIAEVGVAHGDFSEYLLNELQPRKFVALDTFTIVALRWKSKLEWAIQIWQNIPINHSISFT
jgi:hypothetical protein